MQDNPPVVIERPDRKLLFLLVPAVIASAVTGNTYITAIPSFLAIIASYYNNFYFPKNSFKSTLYCLGIFGLSLIIHLFIVTDLPTGNGPHVMAASMIVLMVYLWYYQNPKVTGNIIVLLSLLVLIFTGNNLDNGQSPYPYVISLLMCNMLLFLFSGMKKLVSRLNIFIMLLSVILIFSLSYAFNKILFIAESEISALIQDSGVLSFNTNKVGLSSQFSIESHVKLKMSNTPVMVIQSAKKITYLRADVMTHYFKRNWTPVNQPPEEPVKFSLAGKEALSYDNNSRLEVENDKAISTGNIRFLESQGEFLPLPPDTRAFNGSSLKVKAFYTVENKSQLSTFPFWTGANEDIPAAGSDPGQLEVSNEISSQLKPLGLSIVENAGNNLEKAKLIEKYFQNNYTYSLEVNFDPDKEPVVDFVLNNKKGFCSHFASGMVLILRSIGVPAHVVSGYLAGEYSAALGEYIVRERDAHAWVEVYDPKNKEWVTFDSTPINQMVAYTAAETSWKDDLVLYFKVLWMKVKTFVTSISAGDVNRIVFSWPVLLILVCIIAFFSYKKFRKKGTVTNIEERDIKIETLVNNFNRLLEKNNIKFKDTMTYGELLEEIKVSEHVEPESKEKFVGIINDYQKYRYSSERSEEAFKSLDAKIASKPQ